MCRSHTHITVLFVFGKHVVFVYLTLVIFSMCVCWAQTHMARSMHWFAAFMHKSNAWIGFLSLSLSRLHLISLDACSYRLTSHFHCTLLIPFRCMRSCVCIVFHSLYSKNALPPVAEIFASIHSILHNAIWVEFKVFIVVILKFSFRLTLLPITNGWHSFPYVLFAASNAFA